MNQEDIKQNTPDQSISTVDITIGPNMFGRMSDMKNTPSHVLAEFVDNALQSYRDHKELLEANEPDYKLEVDIDFEWNETDKSKSIIHVTDNAAGIDEHHYMEAFKMANTPEDNTGLNEFGMGLKSAALWLGENWSLASSALGEAIERSTTFDLSRVMSNSLKSLPIFTNSVDSADHYTKITITNLNSNAPSAKSLQKIKNELISIYRKSLRSGEIILKVCGEPLVFVEPAVLQAPSAKTPNGPIITWRKEIDFKFGNRYKAKGFIGILRDIDSTKNGFVLLRRGRVVIGAESDGRYFPKSLCGSSGTFRYKRMFGELELEGFDVAFNKNDIKDRENLEALMDALKDVIHTRDFDLYNQAEDYRLDVRSKQVNRIVRSHNNTSTKKEEVVSVKTVKTEGQPTMIVKPAEQPVQTTISFEPTPLPEQTVQTEHLVMGEYDDFFKVNNVKYQLNVKFVNGGSGLIWIDKTQKKDNLVVCNINAHHPFFNHYFQNKIDQSAIALMKAMAMAKFTAKEMGNDTTAEFFECFNEYIKQTKV